MNTFILCALFIVHYFLCTGLPFHKPRKRLSPVDEGQSGVVGLDPEAIP